MFELTLKFAEDDLNAILKAAHFGDGEPWTVETLKKAGLYEKFTNELEVTSDNFVWEIIDSSRDACANDWLWGFHDGPEKGYRKEPGEE